MIPLIGNEMMRDLTMDKGPSAGQRCIIRTAEGRYFSTKADDAAKHARFFVAHDNDHGDYVQATHWLPIKEIK